MKSFDALYEELKAELEKEVEIESDDATCCGGETNDESENDESEKEAVTIDMIVDYIKNKDSETPVSPEVLSILFHEVKEILSGNEEKLEHEKEEIEDENVEAEVETEVETEVE